MSDPIRDRAGIIFTEFIKSEILPKISLGLERERQINVSPDELYSYLVKDRKPKKIIQKKKNTQSVFDKIETSVVIEDDSDLKVETFGKYFKEEKYGFLVRELSNRDIITCRVVKGDEFIELNDEMKDVARKMNIYVVEDEIFFEN